MSHAAIRYFPSGEGEKGGRGGWSEHVHGGGAAGDFFFPSRGMTMLLLESSWCFVVEEVCPLDNVAMGERRRVYIHVNRVLCSGSSIAVDCPAILRLPCWPTTRDDIHHQVSTVADTVNIQNMQADGAPAVFGRLDFFQITK